MNATRLSDSGGAEEPYMLSADDTGELGKSLPCSGHISASLIGFVSPASL